MSEKRVLRKMKKLASRINDQMETVRDIMEDLEIEFEVLKATVKRLKNVETAQEAPQEEIVEEVDLENTTIIRKF